MGGTVPERDESLARQLGCCIPNLQVFQRRQDGILHDKCNRIAQFLLPSPKPPEERVSEFAGIIKSPVSGNIWDREKMDRPNPEPGKNPGRSGSHVPGEDAGVTKKRRNAKSKYTPGLYGRSWHADLFLICINQGLNNRVWCQALSIIIEALNLQRKFHTLFQLPCSIFSSRSRL